MITSGRKVVTTAGTRVQMPGQSCKQAIITAESDNTGLIVVGAVNVVATLATRVGVPLAPGESIVVGLTADLSEIYLDSTVNGDGVTYVALDVPGVLQVDKGSLGGIYKATPVTKTDGQRGDLVTDINENLKVTQGTAIAGEDLVNDVLKTENRFSGSGVLTADGLVKSGVGLVHAVTFSCSDAAPTAGTISILDSTAAGAGTALFTFDVQTTWFPPFTIILDQAFSVGLYVDFTTTADVKVVCSYR